MRLVVLLLDATSNDVQLRLRLGNADAGFKPPDEVRAVHEATSQLILSRLIRQPKVVVSECKLKTRRQHSDDRVTLTIDRQRTPDNCWIAAELSLPEPVSEDRYPCSSRVVLTRLECSSEN